MGPAEWAPVGRGRLTLDEAARRHGLSKQRLGRAARELRLPMLRTGRQIWIAEDDLARAMRSVPWMLEEAADRRRLAHASGGQSVA